MRKSSPRIWTKSAACIESAHSKKAGYMMEDSNRIGKNIKALRNFWGLTQEDLARAIFGDDSNSKSKISDYERGARHPSDKRLKLIADFFRVAVEKLKTEDYSYLSSLSISDFGYISSRDLECIVPIVFSEESIRNNRFVRAYENHRILYKRLTILLSDCLSMIRTIANNEDCEEQIKKAESTFERNSFSVLQEELILCYNGYVDVFEDEDSRFAAAANIVGLWILASSIQKFDMLSEKSVGIDIVIALMKRNAKNEILAYELFDESDENPNSLLANDKNELLEFIDEWLSDHDAQVEMEKLLNLLRTSPQWYDLAYYYFILYYVLAGISSEDESNISESFDRFALILLLSKMGNPFAKKLLQFWERL